MSWKSGSSSTVRSYQFLYDNQNFLTWATYLENNTANSRYTTRYVYDSMGNITTLWRYGLRDNNTYGLIDNLSYTYNGNQLVTVTDAVSGPNYSGAFHFRDGADEDSEYEYDQNGNLTKDLNKKITQIKYNLLNLPSNIAFMINYANYYISHTYSADGRLLHTGYLIGKDMGPVPDTPYPVFPHGGDELQAHIIDVPITPPIEPSLIDKSYSYCDNIIYHQGTVSQILFDGGYVTLSGSTPTYHYYLQDHLGNNRVVVKQDGTIEQVNHYYPFGGLFGESTNGDVQRFKYNGKELERMHGLDWYDYGARHLDAALGRWTTVDPMAEKYYHLSPYNYCGGNPVRFIDPNGMSCSPIYNQDGKFLGTDDEGLTGNPIVMNDNEFKQGMSHSDAESNSTKFDEMSDEAFGNMMNHYLNLPNRPDYDGYLTLDEANEWYASGKGQPLFTDLSKIDLSGIKSLGEKYVGQVKTFNLLIVSNNINDGLVYGNITLKRYPNDYVRAYADRYDFDMKPWGNPVNWGRNVETIIGKNVAGEGIPYTINIYGSKQLMPLLP